MTIRSARAQIEVDPLFAFAATAGAALRGRGRACGMQSKRGGAAAAASSDGVAKSEQREASTKARRGLARVAEAMPAWQAGGAAQRTNECKSLCSRAGLGFVPIS